MKQLEEKIIEEWKNEVSRINDVGLAMLQNSICLWWMNKLASQKEEIVKMIEGMKGFSRNPDYYIKLKHRLSGNIAMMGVDYFQLSQISCEAKDLILDDIISQLENK